MCCSTFRREGRRWNSVASILGSIVLRMEDADGRIVGSLVNFGCHPVSIYPHFPTAVSADYPAFVARVVEQAEGGVSLFTLGLAGNTVPIQRGAKPREQIGKAVGGEAARKLQFVATTDDAPLHAASAGR